MMNSGIPDKNGFEIKSGDTLKDDWQGFLYKVSYKNGSFILTSTGYRMNGNKMEKDWLGKGRTSQIYDNFKGFSKRHEIIDNSVAKTSKPKLGGKVTGRWPFEGSDLRFK